MIRVVLLGLLIWCTTGDVAQAQSESFTISTDIIATDTATPTAPTALTATADTPTQATLIWGASTDNIGVAGYQVWRDGVAIATTTLLSYVDSPVTASTTYSYYVTAFDAAGNRSASSNIEILTMPSDIPPTVAGGSRGTLLQAVNINDLTIESTTDTITITFTTDQYVRTQVTYNPITTSQADIVASNQLRREHQIVLTDLTPDTTYSVALSLTRSDTFDRYQDDGPSIWTIRTKPLVDTTPPPNAQNFTASETSAGVALTWQNPVIDDFARVRIVQSDRFFPLDVADGWVVYEGTTERFVDQTPITSGVRYYTLFVIDAAGNVSSGAITLIRLTATGDVPVVSPPATSTPPAPDWSLQLDILQGATTTIINGDTYVLPSAEPFVLRIPTDSLPPHLKTIVVTITSATDRRATFGFLLRKTTDGTAYEATIDALPTVGTYPLTIDWYDFGANQAYQWSGYLEVLAAPIAPAVSTQQIDWRWWSLVGVLLVLIYVWYRQRT